METKYKVELNAAATTQLAKAIVSGAEKGVFVLPKGKEDLIKSVRLFLAFTCPQAPLVRSNWRRRLRLRSRKMLRKKFVFAISGATP